MADVAVTLQPGQQYPVSVTNSITTVGTASPLTNIGVAISSVAGVNATVTGTSERIVTVIGGGSGGSNGVSPTLSVASTVATVPSGTTGSASLNNADPTRPVLSLTLPVGATGATGATGAAGTSSLPSNFTVNLASGATIGSYSNGSTIPSGTSLLTVVQNMLTTVIPASYRNPSCTVTATGSTTVEFGTAISSTIRVVFTQNDAGAASSYVIRRDSTVVANAETFSFTVSKLEASISFSGSVSYLQGPQKLNNLGQNSGTPIPANTINSSSGPTFTPVRAMFYAASTATSAPTTSQTVRDLRTPDISGSTSFSINAATGSTSLTIALVSTRSLSQVSFTQNGVTSPVPVANFTTSTVSVAGANASTAVNYTVYFLQILGGLGSAGTFNVQTT
jgi:hypothetical protein